MRLRVVKFSRLQDATVLDVLGAGTVVVEGVAAGGVVDVPAVGVVAGAVVAGLVCSIQYVENWGFEGGMLLFPNLAMYVFPPDVIVSMGL
jgi:hypothetical protein